MGTPFNSASWVRPHAKPVSSTTSASGSAKHLSHDDLQEKAQAKLRRRVKGSFLPIYTVNDWNCVKYYIGTDYRCSAAGTAGHSDQVDMYITQNMTAQVMFHDGSIDSVTLYVDWRDTEYYDMGTRCNTRTSECYVLVETLGHKVRIDAAELLIDPTTIKS